MALKASDKERLDKALDTLRNADALSQAAADRHIAQHPEDAGQRAAYRLGWVIWQIKRTLPVIESALRMSQEPGDAEEIVARMQAACDREDDDPGRIAGLGCYFPHSCRDSERREGQSVLLWMDGVSADAELLSENWKRTAEMSSEVLAVVETIGDDLLAAAETAPREDVSATGHLSEEVA